MLIVNTPVNDGGHEEEGHPERPARLLAAGAGVADLHLGDDLLVVDERHATRAELARVHEPTYLDELGTFCYEGGGDIDQDTYATYDSWAVAQRAAGAGLAVIDELRARGDGVGFVAVRPPGHHALRDRAMGFCLLNNVAVAAASLKALGERVMIVDWDVHHGNGTQAIFWNDPEVLYVSTHQWPLFPGSGGAREIGGLDAVGATLNIPLPAGTTGDVVRQAFEEVALPTIEHFDPTWVLISAGFDAHFDDPMADLKLSGGDFAWLARSVGACAPGPGRVAVFLEGGYDLRALRHSVASSLAALLDINFDAEAPTSGGAGEAEVHHAQSERRVAMRMAEQEI